MCEWLIDQLMSGRHVAAVRTTTGAEYVEPQGVQVHEDANLILVTWGSDLVAIRAAAIESVTLSEEI